MKKTFIVLFVLLTPALCVFALACQKEKSETQQADTAWKEKMERAAVNKNLQAGAMAVRSAHADAKRSCGFTDEQMAEVSEQARLEAAGSEGGGVTAYIRYLREVAKSCREPTSGWGE